MVLGLCVCVCVRLTGWFAWSDLPSSSSSASLYLSSSSSTHTEIIDILSTQELKKCNTCTQLYSLHVLQMHTYSTGFKKLPINRPFNNVPFYENGAWTVEQGRIRSVQFPVPVLPPVSAIIVQPRTHFSPRERASMDARQCLHTARRPLLS